MYFFKPRYKAKKKCMCCDSYVSKPDHDYCLSCWQKKEKKEAYISTEKQFECNISDHKLFTTYIMLYGKTEFKIGFTNDLDSRLFENKRQFPDNKFVYFREFVTEIEARKYEKWLKSLSVRELNKIITSFQNKTSKIERIV